MKAVLFSVALSAGLGAMPAASAQPAGEPVHGTVSISDLDLGKPADRAVLERRIARKARQICADPDVRDLGTRLAAMECEAKAVASTAQQVRQAMAASGTQARGVAVASAAAGD